MKPATPLSPGRPAPPRSATPASVLNAHKLVGGATRVVMLKHRDNAPRPAVSFGGKSVSAVAMLVGGGLELPLPLYCVDDVSKALVDLRPEGAPALRTQNCNRNQITKRAVHDLLRDAQGRLARMPPDSTGEPRSGAELHRDSPALLSALVDSLGVQVLIAQLHSPIAQVTPGYPALLHITRSSFAIDPGFLVFKSGDGEAYIHTSTVDGLNGQGKVPEGLYTPNSSTLRTPAVGRARAGETPASSARTPTSGGMWDTVCGWFGIGRGGTVGGGVGSQWGDADDKVKTEVIERIKGVLTHDVDMFDALLAAAPRHVARAVHNQSALAGVREGVLRRAGVDNKELLDLLSGVIYLRVGARCYDDEIRRMSVVLRTEMHGMQATAAPVHSVCGDSPPQILQTSRT